MYTIILLVFFLSGKFLLYISANIKKINYICNIERLLIMKYSFVNFYIFFCASSKNELILVSIYSSLRSENYDRWW